MITVSFPHGLGDCVYFAHQLPLYQRRGHEIQVISGSDKKCLFQKNFLASQVTSTPKVAWRHAHDLEKLDDINHWKANKAFSNLSADPMPDIGTLDAALWNEFSDVQIDLRESLPATSTEFIAACFKDLPRPITLLHTKGNSFQNAKSVPDPLALEIYREILDQTGGSLILLDWDNRVPRIAHGRVKHLTDDWRKFNTEELLAAILASDLMVGIDSGPLHLSRFTKTPSVGLWFNGHHPAKFSLPRENQVNITLKRNAPNGNKYTRWFYNIVEEQGEQIQATTVGRVCGQLLEKPRFLRSHLSGKDVMLRHWINDWTRAGMSSYQTFIDRNVSYDLMLKHLSDNPAPEIVETGCIRAEEDWRGAGFSSYLFGAFAAAQTGRLESVDVSPTNCSFAQRWTRIFPSTEVKCQDSVAYLRDRRKPVDLLFLDSWDTYVPGFAEHGLREIQEAEHLLHAESMVVYDDTSIRAGKWQGKGTLGVPWLLSRGWRVVHAGHQTVLVRI